MPYSIVKGGGSCKSSEWAVIKDSDGKTMGCHSSKADAEKQLAAIHANEDKKMPELLSHLARVVLPDASRLDTLRDMVTANYAGDNSEDLFYWDAEISNDLLDSHFTHMSESTLRNYAQDANRGVAFLKGHDWRQLPIGYSIQAELEEASSRKRVVASFYTVRSIPEAADLIARMKAGLLRDVSVGFHGGRMVCDICNQDFWDCRHWPGLKYEEKNGDVVTTKLATYTIEDAHLSEVSGVFDGSTPEAMILKAQRAAKRGDLTPEQVDLLERRYRIALPTTRYFTPQGGKKMEEKDFARITTALVDCRVLDAAEVASVDDTNLAALVEKASQRLQSLESQALEGQEYRASLIEDALAEGVRAQGTSFNRSLYETTLKTAPLSVIRQMRDDWKRVADAIFPSGRRSVDSEAVHKPAVSAIPDEAYA